MVQADRLGPKVGGHLAPCCTHRVNQGELSQCCWWQHHKHCPGIIITWVDHSERLCLIWLCYLVCQLSQELWAVDLDLHYNDITAMSNLLRFATGGHLDPNTHLFHISTPQSTGRGNDLNSLVFSCRYCSVTIISDDKHVCHEWSVCLSALSLSQLWLLRKVPTFVWFRDQNVFRSALGCQIWVWIQSQEQPFLALSAVRNMLLYWTLFWRCHHCVVDDFSDEPCLNIAYAQSRVSACPDVKNYKWRLNPVWHRML